MSHVEQCLQLVDVVLYESILVMSYNFVCQGDRHSCLSMEHILLGWASPCLVGSPVVYW